MPSASRITEASNMLPNTTHELSSCIPQEHLRNDPGRASSSLLLLLLLAVDAANMFSAPPGSSDTPLTRQDEAADTNQQ